MLCSGEHNPGLSHSPEYQLPAAAVTDDHKFVCFILNKVVILKLWSTDIQNWPLWAETHCLTRRFVLLFRIALAEAICLLFPLFSFLTPAGFHWVTASSVFQVSDFYLDLPRYCHLPASNSFILLYHSKQNLEILLGPSKQSNRSLLFGIS